jgi:Flp pilus assembly protein TadD
VVHSGSQLVGDRYSYLSGLGFALAAGGAVTWSLGRARERGRFWPSALLVAASVAMVAALMTASWAQSRLWHDSETLWRAAVRLDPDCSICESNLGRALIPAGRLAEAEDHVRRAMALRPERPGPVENLGVIMLARGRYADAEEYFRRIVAKRPDSGMYRNSLAVAIANQGRSVEAEAEFQLARRLDPRLIDGHANLGLLYVRQARYAEAIAPLSRALTIDASHGPARANLARALRARSVELVREGKVDEGARRWQEASSFAGDDPALLAALGQALVEQGRGADAIAVLERAVTLNPEAVGERLWLARAYRMAGRVDQADQEAAALRVLAPALAAELGR